MASNDSGVDISNDSSDGNTTNSSIAFDLDGILNNDSQHHQEVAHRQQQQIQQNTENRQDQEMQQLNKSTSTALSEFVLPSSITLPATINKLDFATNDDEDPGNSSTTNCLKTPAGGGGVGGKIKTVPRRSYKLKLTFRTMANERRLQMAASTCNVETLTYLLEWGTSPNCSDEHKRSPLHLASCRGYVDIVTILLKYGANPNIVDSLGNTPLHLAVVSANSVNFNAVVRILLKSGASVHIRDKCGKNPLELAESKLRLMRTRYKTNTPPEIKKILEDMLILISLILHHFCKEQRDMDELNALEQRLQGLSTSDTDQVENEIDSLLANVERLSMSK